MKKSHKSNELIDEAVSEAKRHNSFYKSESKSYNLVLNERDWEKFASIKVPTDGYTYSIKCLGDLHGKRILEIGCGDGWLSIILIKLGAKCVDAFDVSNEAIKTAQERAKANKVEGKINFKTMSAYNILYPGECFDIVVGQAILHHIRDKDKLANSLYHVLKPGGKAIFFEPFGNSRILERLRLLIPVPVQEEDKTHWDEQIKYKDLYKFKNLFALNYKEFQLLSRLDRIFSSKNMRNIFGHTDLLLMKFLPFLRRYARSIVIELRKEEG